MRAAFRSRDSSFHGMSTYSLSKLAMAILAAEWQRRINQSLPQTAGSGGASSAAAEPGRGRVECVSVNPGSVRSLIWRRVPRWGAGCWDALMALAFLSSEQVRRCVAKHMHSTMGWKATRVLASQASATHTPLSMYTGDCQCASRPLLSSPLLSNAGRRD